MTTNTDTIRALNDRLRQDFSTGRAVITAGVAALGAEAVARIVETIAVYDDFCHANDPYQEHDFGAFEADGHVIYFKIDYYDKNFLVITRLTQPILRSPNASLLSCWRRSTSRAVASVRSAQPRAKMRPRAMTTAFARPGHSPSTSEAIFEPCHGKRPTIGIHSSAFEGPSVVHSGEG